MSNLIPFNFDGKEIRVVEVGGLTCVVAKDVAEALGYTWSGSSSVSHVPDEWKGVESVSTPRGKQDMTVLTEQGLYFFLGRSDKPKALDFQKWIAGEVMPEIRKTGSYTAPGRKTDSGLSSLRTAKALEIAVKAAETVLAKFTSIGDAGKQVIFGNFVNKVAGSELIPLPRLENKTYSAGEVGEVLGISANAVGRMANANGLKVEQYGIFVLDKSRNSEKQVESFRYNDAGVAKLKELLNGASGAGALVPAAH